MIEVRVLGRELIIHNTKEGQHVDIYQTDEATGEKTLDLDKARATLRNSSGASLAETVVRRSQNEILIATMLDVAESLRTLALDASLAMASDYPSIITPNDDADEPDEDRDYLVIGDLVHAIGSDIIAEVHDLGITEDEPYAVVDYQGVKSKEWVRNLVRLRGDERPGPDPKAEVTLDDGYRESDTPLQGVATAAETSALQSDADEDGEPAVGGYELAEGMTDELDDEFEGDDFTASESALAKLKKLEKKPAPKKAASKKGKKS